MTDSKDSHAPTLATWPILGIVLTLLTGALVLEMLVAAHWTEPFRERGTWVLIGVMVGIALRGLGRLLTRYRLKGETPLRRVSLGVWGLTALGGLISLLF